MIIALWVIAALLLLTAVNLQRFMRDMAVAEKDLLKEIKDVKDILRKISEKQL